MTGSGPVPAAAAGRADPPVEVVLCDDHPVVRAGLRALLDTEASLHVVADVATGAEAVGVVASTWPDPDGPHRRPLVVLMDLQLGDGMDGVEATAQLLALPSPPKVLILTTYDTDADILRAVEAGASGYLLKDVDPGSLVAAVHGAARGETVLAPAVARRLDTRRQSPGAELSGRELEVLAAVGAGRTNREIARDLFVSEATVKSHLVHIFTKLGVSSRTQALSAARERGLLR